MEYVLIYILNGLYFTSFVFLTSLGLNIILGVMGILNLAHGALYAIGAFVAAWLIGSMFAGMSVLLILAGGLVAAIGIAGACGLLMEISLIRPMYNRTLEYQLLITFGAMLAVEGLIKMIWGGQSYYASAPFVSMGSIEIVGSVYPVYFIFAMLLSFATGFGLWLLLSKTRLGIMLRAISMDREMAQAMGIRIKWFNTLAFALGAGLAGLAGALIIPTTPATLGIGMDPLIRAFIVVVIGGLGSLRGALLGSLIVGETRSFGVAYFPEIELPLLFLVAVVILVVKPEGLFGSK